MKPSENLKLLLSQTFLWVAPNACKTERGTWRVQYRRMDKSVRSIKRKNKEEVEKIRDELLKRVVSGESKRGRKGRSIRGRKPSRLSHDDVLFIRRNHLKYKKVQMARMFGVNPKTVERIVAGRMWRGLKEQTVKICGGKILIDSDDAERINGRHWVLRGEEIICARTQTPLLDFLFLHPVARISGDKTDFRKHCFALSHKKPPPKRLPVFIIKKKGRSVGYVVAKRVLGKNYQFYVSKKNRLYSYKLARRLAKMPLERVPVFWEEYREKKRKENAGLLPSQLHDDNQGLDYETLSQMSHAYKI